MKTFALSAPLLIAAVLVAGCSGGSDEGTGEEIVLREGMGAISGLLVDDVYRPIPGGLILLEGVGLTATSDEQGQFSIIDVPPGAHIALASAPRHEASPVPVDVVKGEYADLHIIARRLFSLDGLVVTTQYSVFIPCATTTPALTGTYGCLPDSSGDSYRPGLSRLNFTGEPDLTYLVAEIKINMKDNYLFVLRHDNGESLGGEGYGEAWINMTDYGKVVLKKDANYQSWQDNANWTNSASKPLAAILFYMGTGGGEISQAVCTVPSPACLNYFGAGQKFAIKGNIIITAFIGEPPTPIDEYHVMSATP